MKKLLKWFGIVAGTLVALLIIGIVALPFIFPLEKIKEFAVAKISETIHREVKIEKVSFNIFTGIKLEKLSVSNRAGWAKQPFVSADSIDLHYAFWPLFSRQIIIKEIALVKPEILVEKRGSEFNFSDMLTPVKRTTPDETRLAPAQRPTKPPFDLFISSFTIKDGEITYNDRAAGTKNEVKNFNLGVSGFELALVKPINFKVSADIAYQGKIIPLSLSGQVALDMANEIVRIPTVALNIAGEKADLSARISDLKSGPAVDFKISSSKLTVDPLLALFAAPTTVEKPKAKPGEMTKTVNQLAASLPGKLRVKGGLNISNLTFQEFKVDEAQLDLNLVNKAAAINITLLKFYDGLLTGKLKADLKVPGLGYSGNLNLAGFDAHPFSNSVVNTFLTKMPDYKDLIDKVYGKLDLTVNLTGRGVEVPDIMANAVASGTFALRNGELKRLKTIESIADQLKSPALKQDLKVTELSSGFSFKNQILNLANLTLRDHDLAVFFSGGLDLAGLKYVAGNRLTLKGSPDLTKNLSREYNLLRDEKGWLEVTFELKGDLKKPIPMPILGKPIEAAVGKLKVKIDAAKVEIEQKAKAEIASKEAEAQKALEAEKSTPPGRG